MLSLRIAPSIRDEAFGFILHLDKPDYSSIAENKKAPLSCKVHVIDSSLLKSDLVITMTFILLQRRLFLGKKLYRDLFACPWLHQVCVQHDVIYFQAFPLRC